MVVWRPFPYSSGEPDGKTSGTSNATSVSIRLLGWANHVILWLCKDYTADVADSSAFYSTSRVLGFTRLSVESIERFCRSFQAEGWMGI